MDGVVDKLLSLQNGRLLLPFLIIVVIYFGVKGIAGLHQSRTSTRREFLELMKDHAAKDDLWLSVAVRHQFGAYLPVTLIRHLLGSKQPARALLEVSEAWELIDMDDQTGELRWRRTRHDSRGKRKWIARGHLLAYFITAFCSMMLAYLLVTSRAPITDSPVWWLWVSMGAGYALWSIHRRELLKTSSQALERWVGLS
ncbi:hypothetical protein [Stenotrophomonas tumulicola]|uniref:Uncharacterized protein n=1 Tax=Stenotrophomonas tumulicola TaxID=1685415 RepID=A0A7W3III1_9GAMM|nr:hypothetical protein [Stenotrophomonas tumulicola]MBA8683120.1 hypothetical protein [Stenotrophomonas tumulicola]